jgi:ABC-type nitrate/sulfonate/bicarbonate transport system substrate-binding protein
VIVPLQRAGEAITYWSTDRYVPMPSQTYLATRDFIARNPDTVMAFLRAMKSAVDDILDRPLRAIYERAAKDFDIPGIRDVDALIAVTEAGRKLILAKGRENVLRNIPALWQTGVDELREGGIISGRDAAGFYTNQFVDRLRG